MFRIIANAREFREYVLLKDGQSVLLRLATPAELSAVHAMLNHLLAIRGRARPPHVVRRHLRTVLP